MTSQYAGPAPASDTDRCCSRLNKSNYYLENMIELADKPMDDRVVYHLNHDLISDGGQVTSFPRFAYLCVC
jgi:aminopeptidase C